MNFSKIKLDFYLLLIFALIIIVYLAPDFAFLIIFPILIISYYRIIIKRDVATILILMMISRLIMGPFIQNSDFSFNLLNVLCNYLPFLIIIVFNSHNLKGIETKRFISLKWTLLYLIFTLLFGLFTIKYTFSIFFREILPLILFVILMLSSNDKKIDYHFLLKFFRYSFIACIIIYLSPNFIEHTYYLFANGIIFKESTPDVILTVAGIIPRNTGFTFDFRILGQLACIYLVLLYYLNKKRNYFDLFLIITVVLMTFSRGPIIILLLLIIPIYFSDKIKINKRLIFISLVVISLSTVGIIYTIKDNVVQKFLTTFSPTSEDNAISQRGIFISYSLEKFAQKPLGNGIGTLSSPKADNNIFAGYTNMHKKVPDKVFYHAVTDAYLAVTLGEKGIIGFILFLLSTLEIFYFARDRVSKFFLIGLFLNLIGTDIPKEGFFYFVIIAIYFGVSQLAKKNQINI